jgi:hypothetical protein
MNILERLKSTKSLSGKVNLGCLWLLGVPVPILIVIFLFRSCSGS